MKKINRRNFIKSTAGAGLLATLHGCKPGAGKNSVTIEQLDRAAARPILKKEFFNSPVIIESIELLRNGKHFFLRATSTDGAVGLTMANRAVLINVYPILLNRVIPYLIGKDARDLEALHEGLYRYRSNYKRQGLTFWVSVASAEFVILDLLGQIAGKPVGELLGGIVRKDVHIYRASGNRGNTAEDEVAYLQKLVDETGAKAIKCRAGGRMSKNADSLPGRTEALIPLVRETLGDDMTLYIDANGSYDAPKAIEVGRQLEEYNYAFFEEPCPFDYHDETKLVADTLTIPIAGGEEESSMRRMRWMIHNSEVQVIQPDLQYFGGLIRSIKVARMAQEAGMPCTAHISGSGLGHLYMLHFASCVPNIGPHQEYKGLEDIPFECETSSLLSEDGSVRVPTGPGFGIKLDPDFVRKAEKITAI